MLDNWIQQKEKVDEMVVVDEELELLDNKTIESKEGGVVEVQIVYMCQNFVVLEGLGLEMDWMRWV
jgi:hypothetical protein